MKRIHFLLCVCAIFVFFAFNTTLCFAATDDLANYNTLFDAQVSAMLKQAIKSGNKSALQGQLVGEDGSVYSVDVYELDTSNLTRNLNSTNDTVFSNTLAADLSSAQLISRGSNTNKSDWDKTQSVCFYSTIYFTKSTDSTGFETALLTAVSGNYKIYESAISVSNQTLTYGCVGVPSSSRNQHASKKPSKNSYSYNTGFSTYVINNGGGQIGSTYQADLTRNSSKWTFTLSNQL